MAPGWRGFTLPACGLMAALAATGAHGQGTSGENYSAGKPPAQLFSSDCTGSGCHSRPQGLSQGRSSGELTNYLRAHYTNSRQTAALLAGYLMAVGGDSRSARTERPERTERSATPPAPERTERQERDWLPFRLPNLFGREEAEKPEAETTAIPPARSRSQARQSPKTEEAQRRENGARPPRQESPERTATENPLFSLIPGLFGREEEAKPPQSTAKLPPRARQTTRQAPKPEETAKPPSEGSQRAPPRPRQTTRQPPKPEETAKPPASTGMAPARSRRGAPALPKTEDNAGPPGADEIFRPARRDQSTVEPPKSDDGLDPAHITNSIMPVRGSANPGAGIAGEDARSAAQPAPRGHIFD